MIEPLEENYLNADINKLIKKINECVEELNKPEPVVKPAPVKKAVAKPASTKKATTKKSSPKK